MRNQSANQEFENNSMEVALEALGKSIARWTDKGDQPMTAIPGLSLYRRYEPSHLHLVPDVFWMQLGIENIKAARLLTDAGGDVLMNQCIKVDHAKLCK